MFGRTIPNLFADYVGRLNVLCPVILVNAGLVFAMFGVKSTGAVVIFCILYGFFSGACKCTQARCEQETDFGPIVISLIPPAVALFSRSVDELGYVLVLSGSSPPLILTLHAGFAWD